MALRTAFDTCEVRWSGWCAVACQTQLKFDSTQELRTVCELNRITKADFEQKSSEVDT